jgi:hypothetical protein
LCVTAAAPASTSAAYRAALDELVLRILQHGLLDGSGARFDPSIVRIGVNVHHSVKQVSLEAQLEQKLGTGERVRQHVHAHMLPRPNVSVVLCVLSPSSCVTPHSADSGVMLLRSHAAHPRACCV